MRLPPPKNRRTTAGANRSRAAAPARPTASRKKRSLKRALLLLLDRINPFSFLERLNERQTRITRLALIGFLCVVLVYYFTLSPKGFFARMELSRQIDLQKRENGGIALKINELKGEIERLKSDKGYIESIARNELGLARPGESIYKYRSQQ